MDMYMPNNEATLRSNCPCCWQPLEMSGNFTNTPRFGTICGCCHALLRVYPHSPHRVVLSVMQPGKGLLVIH
ncbi:hypothetical protein HY491_01330 [Candidatus Woesearchaeota archaeon]|nr:hypothetical protein [Candidatus Woesearchaeota archaeon]